MVADRLAARQWEAYLAERVVGRECRAWPGPLAETYREWTERIWLLRAAPDAPVLLAPRQSAALWRRVVAESAEGPELLGVAGAAAWAEDAWRRVAAWRIDLRPFDAARHGTDFGAFLRWAEDYRTRLADGGWIDAAGLDAALAAAVELPSVPVVLADFEATPAQEKVIERLRASGATITTAAPPECPGAAYRIRCADPLDELRAAAAWAARRLDEHPSARVAIVVDDLAERADEVRRALLETLGGGNASPPPLFVAAPAADVDALPLAGAALNALELVSPKGAFSHLSRWLRNPRFHWDPRSSAAAARAEAKLREALGASLPFLEAYRRAGLADRLRAAAPDAAAKLDAALDLLGLDGAARTPAQWVRIWPPVLEALGWPGWPEGDAAGDAERQSWERALEDVARLTPIVGAIRAPRALAELEAGLRGGPLAPMPVTGIHVLADLGDVGPGYAGCWVAGVAATAYPRPVRVNPLLPRSLQAEHGLPWSSPRDALLRSRALVARLIARVPEAVLSWPARVRDEAADPSPLIRDLRPLERPIPGPARRPDPPPRARETVADPPPPLAEPEIRGGVAAVAAQALCPLRAFCEHRLGARPLARPEPGVPARLQGVILHRALERFVRRYASRDALSAAAGPEIAAAARSATRAAAAETFGAARDALPALLEIESQRAAALIEAFAAKELERSPYRVKALEWPLEIEIRGKTIRCRIDRVDELAGGDGLAVIDYKSGHAPQAPRADALRGDLQLPIYAVALSPGVAALAVAALRAERVGYLGIWPRGAFPGRPRDTGEHATLDALIEAWRSAIHALVDAYAAGDTRFFLGDDAAAGPYAPLTRVHEQTALHRGWLAPWSPP
ncbi:MAG TPA: PD-(D/E)XK nuclease family protein [Gammaproteobacteria bacterium]